jgi:hypothetical protein
MWVLFLAVYDFNPPERHGRTTITYRAGQLILVRRVCAEAAIARGVAIVAVRPTREAR